MRQGELFGLQWEDFDWTSGTLQVRHSLEELKGKLRLKDVKTKHGRRRIKLAATTLALRCTNTINPNSPKGTSAAGCSAIRTAVGCASQT